MTRIGMFVALVALVVLVIAGPGQAESAGELRVAERTITVSVPPTSGAISILPTPGSPQVQSAWFKSIDDRDVR